MSKKPSIFSYKGFTLVELMVSIAIIALLTAIITANFAGSRSQARDGQRVSDLGQIQLALSLFFDRCGTYATTTSGTINVTTLASSGCMDQQGNRIKFTDYLPKIPVPPTPKSAGGQAYYEYISNDANTPTDFVLHTMLEGTNNATKNSLTVLPSWASSFTCDSTVNYCLGSK